MKIISIVSKMLVLFKKKSFKQFDNFNLVQQFHNNIRYIMIITTPAIIILKNIIVSVCTALY